MNRALTVRLSLIPVCLLAAIPIALLARGARSETSRAAMVAALVGLRVIEPRLTGGFEHAPVTPREPGSADRIRAAGKFREIATRLMRRESRLSPESLADRGAFQLLQGNESKAVADLTAATAKQPVAASAWSDLGAALLVRASHDRRLEDLFLALDATDRAVDLNPDLEEALFNRAMAFEQLHLQQDAAMAWSEFVARGSADGWLEEARARLERSLRPSAVVAWREDRERLVAALAADDRASAREQLVAAHPQAARELGEDWLLGAWAESRDERDLATVARLGDVIADLLGEELLRDTVDGLRTAGRSTTGERDLLARGIAAYSKGKVHYDALDTHTAASWFERSFVALDRAQSPMRYLAEFYLILCRDYWDRDLDAALIGFDQLAAELAGQPYPSLRGLVDYMRALIHLNRSDFGGALDLYRHAENHFSDARQWQNLALARFGMAETYERLGSRRRAWNELEGATVLLERIHRTRWVYAILARAAGLASGMGFHRHALRFQDRAVEAAAAAPEIAALPESLLKRARLHFEIGSAERALDDLQKAGKVIARLPPEVGALLGAQRDLTLGRVLIEPDPHRAVAVLERSRVYYQAEQLEVLAAEVLELLGAARLAGGDELAAADAFLAGVETFERYRATADHRDLRIAYFDQSRRLFDWLVQLELRNGGGPERAFDLVERARARELTSELTAGHAGAVVGIEALSSALPEGHVLVEYYWLEDRLLVWVVRRGGWDFMRLESDRADIRRQIEVFVGALGGPPDDALAARLSTILYDRLIAPLKYFLRRDDEILVLAADGALHGLPFAALRNRRTGRYMVEEHTLATTPSAGLYLHALARDRTLAATSDLLLAVGNPAFDSTAFAWLDRLADSEAEAEAVAGLWSGRAQLLTGAEADRDSFLAAAEQAAVIHFAGHAIANPEYPFLSQLVLAPSGDNSGALTVDELYRCSFPRLRLVILAACSSGLSRISPGEGRLNLALPFLAAGVPGVVASLWGVDDRGSRALFEAFHRRLSAGESPPGALRDAQLELLRSADADLRRPSVWAAYQLIGAAALVRAKRRE